MEKYGIEEGNEEKAEKSCQNQCQQTSNESLQCSEEVLYFFLSPFITLEFITFVQWSICLPALQSALHHW